MNKIDDAFCDNQSRFFMACELFLLAWMNKQKQRKKGGEIIKRKEKYHRRQKRQTEQ